MVFTERDIYDFLDRVNYPRTGEGEYQWRRFVVLGVVSLFWDQTASEQVHRMSHIKNDRGYSQSDAPQASKWALAFLRSLPDDVETADDVLAIDPRKLMLIPVSDMRAAVTMLGHYRKQLATKLNNFHHQDYTNEMVARNELEMKKKPVVDDIKKTTETMRVSDLEQPDDDFFSRFEKANVFEAAMTNAKPDYLKRMEAVMRNDRIQAMKKQTVVPDKTKYDRKEHRKSCDME